MPSSSRPAIDGATTDHTTGDVADLLRAVDHPPDGGPGGVVRVGSGAWSDCFGFWHRGVRIGRHRTDFEKDRQAGRLASDRIPTPTVHVLADLAGDEVLAISDFVAGTPLESPAHWPGVAPSVVALLEALGRVDVSEFVGWGPWNGERVAAHSSWRAFLLSVADDGDHHRLRGWRTKMASNGAVVSAFQRGLGELERAIVDAAPRGLVHADLLHGNAHVRRGAIEGVFDWGASIVGDPLYDATMMWFWEPWLPGVEGLRVLTGVTSASSRGLDERLVARRVKTCLLHTGLDHVVYHSWRSAWVFSRIEALTGVELR